MKRLSRGTLPLVVFACSPIASFGSQAEASDLPVLSGRPEGRGNRISTGWTDVRHRAPNITGAGQIPVPQVETANRGAHRIGARDLPLSRELRLERREQLIRNTNLRDLDMTSTKLSVTLDRSLFRSSPNLTITVGGEEKTFSAGSRVTAAEYVALKQLAEDGTQTLGINSDGIAQSGSFSLNSVASRRVGDLVIPTNVTAINLVTSSRKIAVSGDIQNFGSIYGVSIDERLNSGRIIAKEITNEAGATISTTLSDTAKSLAKGGIEDLSLELEARKGITNHGQISSAGNLTLVTTSGGIENTVGSVARNGRATEGSTSPQSTPTITAERDLNIVSGNGEIINSGTMQSLAGNVNVAGATLEQNITVIGGNGSIQALQGDINIRSADYAGPGNITLVGGDYFANNLNLYSGTGKIIGVFGETNAHLNTVAGEEHFYVDTENLYLGNNCVTGDPTFVNKGGNIIINGLNTFNEDVAILASGDILDDGSGTSQIVAHGFNVTLVAGASITSGGGSNQPSNDLGSITQLQGAETAIVNFVTGAGGNINLSNAAVNVIDTSGTTGGTGSKGGNITLTAVGGGGKGSVTLAVNSLLTSYGTGNLSGGDVRIFAGATPVASQTTIQLGSVNTGAGADLTNGQQGGNSGNITISTSAPLSSSGDTVTFNTVGQIIDGFSIVSAPNVASNFANVVIGGDLVTAAPGMSTSNITPIQKASGAGDISIKAGNNISANNLLAFGQGGLGGRSISNGAGGEGGDGGTVSLESINGSINISGSVNTSGGGGGGGGGGGNGISGSLYQLGGAGGVAGAISITAAGSANITGNIFAVDGGAGGTGTSSYYSTPGGAGGGGGSFGGGGGGGGDLAGNGAGGGGGVFGGGAGATAGGGGGGTNQLFPGGGEGAVTPAGDGSALTGGTGGGASPATGGVGLGKGGSGSVGPAITGPGLPGWDAPLDQGGGDVLVSGSSIDVGGDTFGKNVSLATTSPFHTTGNFNATEMLSVSSPQVTISTGNTFKGNLVQVSAGSSDLTVINQGNIEGNSVSVNGTAGFNVILNNQNAITALQNNIEVTSTAASGIGGNLTITGGGLLDVSTGFGVIELTAVAPTTASNSIDFSGNQTFSGTTSITASATGQSVSVQPGVSVIGDSAVFVDTPTLLQNGSLIGAPLILSPGLTYANSTSAVLDISTLGPLVFTHDLAIISFGNIVDNGNDVTINLSNSSGAGGQLTIMAGFVISPDTGGVVGPNHDDYTLTTPFGGGRISLGNTSIITTGSTDGGDVYLYGRGGVTIGNITTTGGSGTSGDVVMAGVSIRQNGLTDTSNAVSANSGDVSITSVPLQITGGLRVQNGRIVSGTVEYLNPQNNITLNSINAGGGSVTINAGGGGALAATGTIAADSLFIRATMSSAIATNVSTLEFHAGQSNPIFNNSSPVLLLKGSEGRNITVNSTGAITTNGNTIPTDNLTISATSLTVSSGDTLSGDNVTISSPLGTDLLINNQGTISATAGGLSITSTAAGMAGGNIVIGGGPSAGVMSSTTLTNIQAVASGASSNGIQFTGSQTFSGKLNLIAEGSNQFITIDAGVAVTGNAYTAVATPLLTLNGTLTGNPLVLNAGATIANSTGSALDISTLGSLIYTSDLAIMSAGDITDGGNTLTLDLSNNAGDGHGLMLIAGFNFTPTTTGTVGPDHLERTITSRGTGSINLGNTTIVTNGTTGGGFVGAYAAGSITIGSIDTSSDTGDAGDVALRGNGVTVLGTINAGNGDGSVSIASGTVSGTNTKILNGRTVAGAGFGISSYGGNISVNSVSAGDISGITLRTGGTGAITVDGILTAQSVTLRGDSGSIGSASNFVDTNTSNLTVTSSGAVYVQNTGALNLFESTAQSLNLKNDSTIEIRDDVVTTGPLSITATEIASPTISWFLRGSSVDLMGVAGQDLNINFAGTITADTGNVNIVSTPLNGAGGNLFVRANFINAPNGQIYLTAEESGDTPNRIEFVGSTALGATTHISASGTAQSVVVANGALLRGPTVFVDTPMLINNGTIDANPLVLSSGSTYARSNGSPLDISNLDLTQSNALLIISAGDITDGGNALSIDLRNIANGLGSPLTLMAGFQFTPSTGGGTDGPDQIERTVTGLGDGNIDLGSTNILTNGVTVGGNVAIYANGSVEIGSINTSTTSTTGVSGDVKIIANGVTVNGAINTSNPGTNKSGEVWISSAQVVYNNVKVQSGLITSGSIYEGVPSGDIQLSGVNSGDNRTIISTGGSGALRSTGVISAKTLNVSAGTGGIGSAADYLEVETSTLGASTPVESFIDNVSAAPLAVRSGTNAGEFHLKSAGDISLETANLVAHVIDITTPGQLFLPSGFGPETDSNGNGGYLSLNIGSLDWTNSDSYSLLLGADAFTGGNGGTVILNTAQPITIGDSGPGVITLWARGGVNGGNGGSVTVTSQGSITVGGDTIGIRVNPRSGSGDGGNISLTGRGILNPDASATVFDVAGVGTGNGGTVSLTTTYDSNVIGNLNFGTGANEFKINANSGASGGNGGGAFVNTSLGIGLGANGINVGALGTQGNGGIIDLVGSAIVSTDGGHLALNVDGSGTGDGGRLRLSASILPTIDPTAPGSASLSAQSGVAGGNGGTIILESDNSIIIDPIALLFGPRGADGNGGHITLAAPSLHWTDELTAPLSLNADGVGTGSGGSVSLNAGAVDITVGSAAGQYSISASSGLAGGNGGEVALATTGTIHLGAGVPSVAPRGANGNGGSLVFSASAYDVLGDAPLTLKVDGVGSGDGGIASITNISQNPMTIGSGASQFSLSAAGGLANGNGGTVAAKSGGNLIVDPTGLHFGPTGQSGNGGTVVLEAGFGAGSGVLIIDGLLDASGKGSGKGGNVTLISDSSTALVIGAKGNIGNGIRKLDVTGSTNGSLTFINSGDVTLQSSVSKVGNLTVTAGGAVNIATKLGDKTTAAVSLKSIGLGQIVTTKKGNTITAGEVILQSSSTSSFASIGNENLPISVSANSLVVNTSSSLISPTNGSSIFVDVNSKTGVDITGGTGSESNGKTVIISKSDLRVNGELWSSQLTVESKSLVTTGDGIIKSSILSLKTAANIGTAASALNTQFDSLSVSSKGDVNVSNTGAAASRLNNISATNLTYTAENDITIAGTVSGKDTVKIVSNSGDIIKPLNNDNTSATGALVQLEAVNGNIGATGNPLDIRASNLVTLTSGSVDIRSLSTKTTTVQNAVGQTLNLDFAGSVILNELTATNGDLIVTTSSRNLATASAAELTATNGALTLQNNNLKKGKISIGANSSIQTNGNGGDVTISIGAPVLDAGVNPDPSLITVNQLGITGGVFFGQNGITASGGNNVLNYKNANVVFSTPLSSKSISLGGGVTITADPPNPVGVETEVVTSAFRYGASPESTTSIKAGTDTVGSKKATIAFTTTQNAFTQLGEGLPANSAFNIIDGAPMENLPPTLVSNSPVANTINLLDASWIGVAESQRGSIQNNNNRAKLFESLKRASKVQANLLSEIVDEKGTESEFNRNMVDGATLLASRRDEVILTPFGKISVERNSVVLIICNKDGLSLFDIHDRRKGAVKLIVGESELSLAPGRHLSVTRSSVQRFEDINPAFLISHRNLNAHSLGNELKAFSSEFSHASAISAVTPLHELLGKPHAHMKPISESVLKTIAVSLHLQGNASFEQKIPNEVITAEFVETISALR